MLEQIPQNPYLLLTPGPLSTSRGVRAAMLRDWCTWDDDYNQGVVQDIRRRLTALPSAWPEQFTAVLMQGSGSFGVEACLGTAVPREGKVLVLANGAYGLRMVRMLETMGRGCTLLRFAETEPPDPERLRAALEADSAVTHVAMVHCETTTGILNPIAALTACAKEYGKTVIVDAMSSFGGVPLDMEVLGADYLISSANKCIQGVPGFSFVIARRALLEQCGGRAHSHSLDLYDQWRAMDQGGKWRFTSPTHVVRAFQQALTELEAEGGVAARFARYTENQRRLSRGLYDYGILKNPKVRVGNAEVGLMTLIGDYLVNSEQGKTTALYGYALHVEVVGVKDGCRKRGVLYHTHPASDGSVEGWEGLRAYTRNVGIPLAIAAEQLAKGAVRKTGILIPEEAFAPQVIFSELKKRGIEMHESWTDL